MSFYRNAPHRTYGGGVIGIPPLTPCVRAIMIACASIWLFQFLFERVLAVASLSAWLGLETAAVLAGRIWQPFTYAWLHSTSDPFHLLFNMLALWMFGGDLERLWGARRLLSYWITCGTGAGLFIVVAEWLFGGRGITVGASGAVYGLIAAYGMLFADRVILFMMIFPMRAQTFAWIMAAVTFVATWSGQSGGVSHVAHLGGLVVGFVVVKRAWRLPNLWRELRWRLRRRRFRVMPPTDRDSYLN